MTIHVNIGEAKDRLSELLAAAKRGEDVIIARAGAPEARLVPIVAEDERAALAAKRRAFIGCLKGAVPEEIDWFAPLSYTEQRLWSGDEAAD